MTTSFPTPQASPAEDRSQEALLAVLCVAHGVKEELENKESLWALGCYYVMVKLDPHSKTQHTSPVGTISGALLGQTDNGLLLSQELIVKGEKREITQLR